MHAPRAIHNPQFGAWYSDTDTGRHAASSSSHGHFARPAVADTDFAGPPNLQLPHRPTLRSSAVPGKMQRPTAAAEEYAALQKLSDEYQPVVVVSFLTSSGRGIWDPTRSITQFGLCLFMIAGPTRWEATVESGHRSRVCNS